MSRAAWLSVAAFGWGSEGCITLGPRAGGGSQAEQLIYDLVERNKQRGGLTLTLQENRQCLGCKTNVTEAAPRASSLWPHLE